MTINPGKLAKNARRTPETTPEKTVVVKAAVSEDEIDEMRRTIDELNFRVLTLEARFNKVIAEVNFHNVYIKAFREQFSNLYKMAWYRFVMWISPRFGLPPFPDRKTIGVIIIKDRKPRM